MNKEFLTTRAEIRSVDDEQRVCKALVLAWDVTDSHGTQFRSGCFSDSLGDRLPKSFYNHDQSQLPIGRAISFEETAEGLEVDFRFSDTTMGRDVYTLIKDEVLTEFSVGFIPTEVRDAKGNEVRSRRMAPGDVLHKGTLFEISPVNLPSVPGTKVLALRSEAEQLIPLASAQEILNRYFQGELSFGQASVALEDARNAEVQPVIPEPRSAPEADQVDEEAEAELRSALAAIDGRIN